MIVRNIMISSAKTLALILHRICQANYVKICWNTLKEPERIKEFNLLFEVLFVLRQDGFPLSLGRVDLGHLVLPTLLLQLVLLSHLRLKRLPLGQLGLADLLDQPFFRVDVVFELEQKAMTSDMRFYWLCKVKRTQSRNHSEVSYINNLIFKCHYNIITGNFLRWASTP